MLMILCKVQNIIYLQFYRYDLGLLALFCLQSVAIIIIYFVFVSVVCSQYVSCF